MGIGKRLAAAVVLATAFGGGWSFADVPAKDWPEFHGPARDNISRETGLLKEWPKGGPKLAYKASGLGDGHASVAVAGGKIFTSGKLNGTVTAIALNEADGKQLWTAAVGGGVRNKEDQGGTGSRATPTVDGDMVYFNSPAGDVVALTVADGKEVWRTNIANEYGGGVPNWGFSDSVLIDGDNLITIPGGGGGTVLALNKKSGKLAWQSTALKEKAHYTSPVMATIGGVRQVVVLTSESVSGINPKDGAVLWRAPRKGAVAVCPSPIVSNDHVFVTSGYDVGCNLFKISNDGGTFRADPVYANKNMVNHHGGVILLDGKLYGHTYGKGGDGWVCMDFMTGDVKWKEAGVGKGTLSYADGRFYLRGERKGTIALIEASPAGYGEKGRFEQPEASGKPYWPHLVIANGKLYVRDMDNLFCYDVKGN